MPAKTKSCGFAGNARNTNVSSVPRFIAPQDLQKAKKKRNNYREKHPYNKPGEDKWKFAYLPADEKELEELNLPSTPLVLEFPHITRRIAAQRSRFVVFGTDPCWFSEQ